MEFDEVAARVIRSYWALLLVMTVVPLTLAALLLGGQTPPSVAQSRIQAGGAAQADVGDAGVSVVVSEVKAFATGDTLLREVLRQQRIERSTTEVAKAIDVAALGTSTIVELSVKDTDPAVARALTDAIGASVVREINKSSQGAVQQRLAEIDERVQELQKRLGPLSRRASAPAPDAGAVNERDLVQAELADLRSDRSDLRTQLLTTGKASVVQPAVLAPKSNPAVMMSAIAGLVGLVGGILIAVVAETVRPTVPGQRRVARRLAVPLLGQADAGPAQLADLGRRVRLAAKKAGVGQVTLVGAPGPLSPELVSTVALAVYGDETRHVSVEPVHARADGAGPPERRPGEHAEPGGEDAGADPSLNSGGKDHAKSSTAVRTSATAVMKKNPAELSPSETTQPVPVRHLCHVHAFEDLDPGSDDVVGVVVAAGPVTTAAGLDTVRDLVAASGWPLLGVVAAPRGTTSPQGRRITRILRITHGRQGT